MRKSIAGAAALTLALAAAGCAGNASAPRKVELVDFRKIVERAKNRVYPALVYVKPIREEYSGGERTKSEVFGSGAVISPDGLVFTNAHVAENATEIRCVLEDKEQYDAELVGLDKETDLALLRLKLPEGHPPLHYVEFADSDKVEEGQHVMAMGSPFGFTRSISWGMISNTRRYIGFETEYKYNLWLQTDAAINGGNSGGPLVDTDGRVVGINTLSIWGADGLGFAIPSNIAKEVLATLKEKGRVPRAWLGLELQALKDFEKNTFHRADCGVLVAGVDDPSPARDAGLANGDLILAVGGAPVSARYVEELPAVRRLIAAMEPEKPVELTVKRGEEEIKLSITPVAKGEFEGKDFDCKRWNLTAKGISRYATPRLYFHHNKGVYVQGVRWPGNAASSGLQASDIIVAIDREEITGVEHLERVYKKILADGGREKKALFTIKRGAYTKQIVLDYRKDYKEENKR